MRVSAMIGRAGLPPMNMISRHYGDWVTVVTDLGDGPVRVTSVVHLHRDRWLLPGSPVTIDIEPDRVGKVRSYDIDWSSVPRIRDRVAANDPVLADPRAARRAAGAAVAGAGLVRPMPPGSAYLPHSGSSADLSWSAACDEAIARASTVPAPAGMIRVVAIVTAMRLLHRDLGHDLAGRPRSEGRRWSQSPYRWALGGNATVLTLNAAGRAPWAVFVPRLRAPAGKRATTQPSAYPWLPALVRADGSGAPKVLWDEVRPYRQQAGAVWQESVRQQHEDFRAEAARHQPVGPDGPVEMPLAAHQEAAAFAKMFPTVPPDRQQAGLAHLRANLAAASPETRELYLALWRSYGIPI